MSTETKRVYTFGDGKAEGNAEMRNLLGGKGANLAEMNLLGMPVPPGFTITTAVCNEYTQYGREKVVAEIRNDVEKAIAHVEELTGKKFNDPANPLLVSVRSGARASMPGMMDTVLNLGMNDATVASLAEKSGNPRFAWDSYRRFVQMYGDVVLGMKPKSKTDIDPFEEIMDKVKEEKGYKLDTELTVDDLKNLVVLFKSAVKEYTGKDFPDNAWEQLWGGICAVFDSWMNERAILYRRMNQIPEEWGTAVNVQAMVYGNMGNNSATGVAFSRDAATGENLFNGEYLINAQGEDVVAGIRTPQQITIEGSRRWAALQGISEEERQSKYPSLEESMPVCANELFAIADRLEAYYKDMQDMEFTIQDGKLWMLQTRNGKRTGAAMVKIAMDLLRAGEIDEKTVLMRMEPQKLDELLHPVFDKAALKHAKVVAKGLPASPGAATGQVVFAADEAEAWGADCICLSGLITPSLDEMAHVCEELERRGFRIVGVSPDGERSHRNFCDKHALGFTLLSDPDHSVCEAYGVWAEKSMYGRKYMGVVRTTFLIDAAGRIERVIAKVDTKNHARQILDLIGAGE